MSLSGIRNAFSGHARAIAVAAALTIALTGVAANGSLASANCATGGNPSNGGTLSVGCAFGGAAGASLAGTIDVSDPAVTVAGSYGGPYGDPGVNAAGVIDLDDPSLVVAGGVGGSFPYPATNIAGSYP